MCLDWAAAGGPQVSGQSPLGQTGAGSSIFGCGQSVCQLLGPINNVNDFWHFKFFIFFLLLLRKC